MVAAREDLSPWRPKLKLAIGKHLISLKCIGDEFGEVAAKEDDNYG